VQVLCREAWGIAPRFEAGPRDLDLALTEHDAAVRIGDKALFDTLPAGAHAYDLGEAWTTLTRLPFVFAVWATRLEAMDRDVYQLLHDSKRAADLVLDVIADDYTYGGRQYPEVARSYLREAIRYRFGAQELAGLRRFLDAAARLGLVPSAFDLRIAFSAEARCGV
jgi:chorismate dehydratase